MAPKHICGVCGRVFSRTTSLEDHLNVHSETKDFVCSVCGWPFTRKQDKERHEKEVHFREAPRYCCKECGRRFTRSSSVGRHRRENCKPTPARPIIPPVPPTSPTQPSTVLDEQSEHAGQQPAPRQMDNLAEFGTSASRYPQFDRTADANCLISTSTLGSSLHVHTPAAADADDLQTCPDSFESPIHSNWFHGDLASIPERILEDMAISQIQLSKGPMSVIPFEDSQNRSMQLHPTETGSHGQHPESSSFYSGTGNEPVYGHHSVTTASHYSHDPDHDHPGSYPFQSNNFADHDLGPNTSISSHHPIDLEAMVPCDDRYENAYLHVGDFVFLVYDDATRLAEESMESSQPTTTPDQETAKEHTTHA